MEGELCLWSPINIVFVFCFFLSFPSAWLFVVSVGALSCCWLVLFFCFVFILCLLKFQISVSKKKKKRPWWHNNSKIKVMHVWVVDSVSLLVTRRLEAASQDMKAEAKQIHKERFCWPALSWKWQQIILVFR